MARTSTKQAKPANAAVSTAIPLPDNPAPAAMRSAIALQREGKFADAIKAYDDVLKVAPNRLAALVNKGVAMRRLGRQKDAMPCFWRALTIDPANVEAWHNTANTLLDLERLEEAEEALRVSLAKAPQIADVWIALWRLLLARKQFPAGEAALGRAIALRSDPDVRMQRATLWLERGKLAEALDEYLALQEIMPDAAPAHTGAGQAMIGLERFEEAFAHLQKGIQCDPGHLDGQLGLARWHLLRGDFVPGWEQYEWRLKRWNLRPSEFAGPEWDGSDPAGKTLLVYAEQGYGDTIQFLRYLPHLAKRGAHIKMFCQKSLVPLIEQMNCAVSVFHVRPRIQDYDFHVALLSLPHKMKLGAEPIPAAVPYLKTPRKALLPVPPLGTRIRAGLVWAGSSTHPDDYNRSVGLPGLMPLASVPGVRLYSLQVGPRAADINKYAHPALIQDFSQHLKTYADTAAVISQLDLVITVDTSVAHLAGALGKPVWVMVPYVPDWRWQMDRNDSPWYPSMRLYRQDKDGDWKPVVQRLVDDLESLATSSPLKIPEPETIEALSIFTDEKGQSRFRMSAPRPLLQDPGISFLMRRERAGIGYEYATRALLDAHLEPNDLFLDIGAHWGIMALQAATRHSGVRALAFEPEAQNLGHLRRWIDDNKVDGQVEIIAAAVSDSAGQGALRPESTMGYSLVRSGEGEILVVSVDQILAERPNLADRRVIIKIDVEGQEPEVISGMSALLKSGRIAMIIWERGVEYNKPDNRQRLDDLCATLAALGFTQWRFKSEDEAGALVPFTEDGTTGNIIALAPGLELRESYGMQRPASVVQPIDPIYDISEKSRALYNEGTTHYTQRKNVTRPLQLYAEAAMLDSRLKDLYNNLGVMLREQMPAARTACYYRAHRIAPGDPGVLSNLANALREEGDFEESQVLHERALALAPDNPNFLYNAALHYRDSGQPDIALPMFERILSINPDHHDCRWDRALILLQMGDYKRGFSAYESRWNIDRAYKRTTPLPRWDGSPLEGRSIFLHDEQGFGDVMQFARFIPELKKRGAGNIVLECQPELMRLMVNTPGVDAVIPRERFVPQCDVYNPLLSLPGLFGTTLETLPDEVPYLFAPDMSAETKAALPNDGRLKVGLVWAGQLIPRDRSCPLDKLLPILNDPRIAPVSLQVGARSGDLKTFGADTFITDMSPYLRDFAETGAVLNELDLLITIDTSVAHLAGALGVPTFLLLRTVSDWRWFDKIDTSPWYPSFRVFRQSDARRWDEPVEAVGRALADFADGKKTL
jgi:FkbM family methyltransferase